MSFPSNVLLHVMSHSSLRALTGCVLPGSVLLSCVPSGLCASGLYASGMCASGFYASKFYHSTLFIYLSWNVAFKVEIQNTSAFGILVSNWIVSIGAFIIQPDKPGQMR